jgi:subtilisin-like proprotein convertase family protein
MRPSVLVALAAAAIALGLASPAAATTRMYSSGDLTLAIPDPGVVESAIAVPDTGPVARASVWVRLAHPNDDDLQISLVAPDGTAVVLADHPGGDGAADFGSGSRECNGTFTVFDDQAGFQPIADGTPPFDGAYRPDEPLEALLGKEAKGAWKLRVEDDNELDAGTLLCWKLELARDVVQKATARAGAVRAELTFREIEYRYTGARLKIYRRGKLAFAGGPNGGCRDCQGMLASDHALRARDLDGDGEPEVFVDLYTGGAHCCFFTLVYRYDPARRAYRKVAHMWGNAGYALRDLGRDGRAELVSGDDRFAYAFTSFAASADPIQIWSYRGGRFADVTRSFPAAVRRDADRLWQGYLQDRKDKGTDVRGVLAAYLADRVLLGEGADGWARLQEALRRGELSPPAEVGPTGAAYLRAVVKLLVDSGYVTRVEAARLFPL